MGAKKIERLWSFQDLLEFMNVPRSTVYQYISQGKIPFHQIGRHKRFDPDEVKKALKRF